MTWTYHPVQGVNPNSATEFARFVTRTEAAIYRFDDMGRLWKSACWIKVWDDGRVFVSMEHHLTKGQRDVVGGLAEKYWRGGPALCRVEKWSRVRQTKSRPVASRVAEFWVQPDRDDPAYAAAHADRNYWVAQTTGCEEHGSYEMDAEGIGEQRPNVTLGGAQ